MLKTAVPRAQNYGYLKKPKKLDKAQEIEKTENLIKKNQLKKLRKQNLTDRKTDKIKG